MADCAPLPEEILVEEILMRLPIKSLVRSQLVCKLWKFVISDPYFVQSQFNRTISQNPNHNDYLILQYKTKTPNVLSIISSSSDLFENKLDCPFIFNKTPRFTDDDIHLVGSINGLVCIARICDQNYYFILWNPAIRAFKIISLPKHCPPVTMEKPTAYLFGFGWDSVADDFKLLAKPESSNLVSVYSCKTDCWSNKVVSKNLPICSVRSWSPCVIVKGNPYWNFYDPKVILKFEVTSNEFKHLTVSRIRGAYNLVNLNDSLARIEYSQYGRDGMHVYRFDEECSLWFKTYTINVKKNDLRVARAMCFKYGGEIVVDEKQKLYDPKSNKIRSYDHDEKRYVCRGHSYTPSMIVVEGMKPLHP